jgi:biopolymer transport protein ExbB
VETLAAWIQATDAVGQAVAALLLMMSVAAWVLIVWKVWVLRRVRADLGPAIAAFWTAHDVSAGAVRLQQLDREGLTYALVQAVLPVRVDHTLEAHTTVQGRLTRRLRDALQSGASVLHFGQVVLASIGSTAPFVGLLGTVWGIYHALIEIGTATAFTLERVAAPVGEALMMTAAGLAVAIPAVLAYNLFGNWASACEAQLEGFAHDLREMAVQSPAVTDTP